MNDPDRFDVFDSLLRDFVREFVLADDDAEEVTKARKAYERLWSRRACCVWKWPGSSEDQDEAAARAEGGE